jgi:hypothetical protein
MRHLPCSRLVRLLVIASLATLGACTDPVDLGGEPEVPELATQHQEQRVTVNVLYRGALITELPVVLGCFSLNGSVFVPDPSGNTQGTTITNSDCHWNSSTQRCECTVTVTQRSAD